MTPKKGKKKGEKKIKKFTNKGEDKENNSPNKVNNTLIYSLNKNDFDIQNKAQENKLKKVLLGESGFHLPPLFLDYKKLIELFQDIPQKERVLEIRRYLKDLLKINNYHIKNIAILELKYYLSKIKIASFTELKERLNLGANEISQNKILWERLKKLEENGELKKVDDLNEDVRFKKEVLKKISKRDTRNYYSLTEKGKEDIDLIDLNIPEEFRIIVDESLNNFEKAKNDYSKLKKEEEIKLKEKEEKKKTKFEKIKEALTPLIDKKILYYDLKRYLCYRKELTSKKNFRDWTKELIRSEIIENISPNSVKILNFIDGEKPSKKSIEQELEEVFSQKPIENQKKDLKLKKMI